MRLFDGNRSEWNPATKENATLKFEVFDWPLDLADLVKFRGRGGDERELTISELYSGFTANRHAGHFGPATPSVAASAPPEMKLPPSAVEAEFHGRVVFSLSMIVLPLLAAPLGIITRRATRSFGLVLGLLIMVSYHKVLEFGEAYASTTGMASAPMLWGTFALFTVGTAALFLRTDATAGATPIQRLEEFWISGAGLIASLFRPSKSSA
jgi:lipopolysaccharide export system permease protein